MPKSVFVGDFSENPLRLRGTCRQRADFRSRSMDRRWQVRANLVLQKYCKVFRQPPALRHSLFSTSSLSLSKTPAAVGVPLEPVTEV